jgi:predicted nuclease with TOPRIM domain
LRLYLAPIAVSILIFAMLVSTTSAASGFNYVKDEGVMIKLSYPVEVENNSCFKITVEITTLTAVENLTVVLKLTYLADSTSSKFYEKKLVNNVDTYEPDLVYSGTISVCLPTITKPDPYVKGEVTATYFDAVDDEYILSDAFYMTTVRTPSYSKLQSMYNDAKNEIDVLKSEISELKQQIDTLNKELDSARYDNVVLITKLSILDKDYSELKKKYEDLQKKYDDLNSVYTNLVKDYGSLRGTHESLMKNYEALQEDYQSLRRDYELVSRELTTIQTIYNDLKARYSDLQENYGEAIKTIGELKGIADEREKNLNVLQAMLSQAASEGSIIKSLAAAQSVGLAGIGIYLLYKRKGEKRGQIAKADDKVNGRPEESSLKTTEVKQDTASNVELKESRPLKILSGRRITIPMNIAEELGLKVGDLVRLYKDGEYLIIKPERIVASPNNGQNALEQTRPAN